MKCLNCHKFFEKRHKNQVRKFCSCPCEWSYKKGRKNSKVSGSKNGNWHGGKTKNDAGYVFLLSKNHPFSENRGYVREHRLVMEKHLGRYLHPKEVVHHINKIKDDNRLENLELYSSSGEHTSMHFRELNLKVVFIPKKR